jgi:SNW domain-containing protein 1
VDLPGPPAAAVPGPPGGGREPERLSEAERAEKRKRDELRRERAKERERELRQEERDRAGGAKRSQLTRDRDRDVGEKMALGQADVSRTREVQYDSRLFNREAGLGSGFTADESYNFYDKELFADRSAMAMYRSRDARDAEVYGGGGDKEPVATQRFAPDKGFAGTEATGGERLGPVQFDRAARGGAATAEPEADPFGIDSFLGGVSKR